MNRISSIFGLTCVLITLPIVPLAAISPSVEQFQQEISHSKQYGSRRLEFTPPDDFEGEGRPRGGSGAGGTRGDCLQQLLALSPKPTETAIESEFCQLPDEDIPTLTVSEFPTFWFYVPDQGGQVSAEFTLFNPQGQPVRQQVVLSGEAGIVGIRLTQPLAVDRSYTWRFRIDEAPGDAPKNPTVRGTVQRIAIDPTLAAQLEAASAQERITLYAAEGIWQDTLTALVQLRQAQPNNAELQADWSSLLTSVHLGSVTTAPILDCCTSQPATSQPVSY